MSSPQPPSKILIILHQEHSTPGRVGRLLQAHGWTLDIRRPRFDEPLPATMEQHAGAVIFGGPMSANDGDDYIRREIDWINVPLAEGKPFLGICLGAQMLSKTLGQRVYTHADGRVEIGYYPIRATPDMMALCGRCEARIPTHVYHWHREGFDLPPGGTLLADGDDFPVQAFRYGSAACGIQFHPEVTYAMMCRWTTRAADRMTAPGARARHLHLDDWFQYDGAVAHWIDRFLRLWAAAGNSAAWALPASGATS
jgi:GMP synthase (glutamine-hydrolysing)